MSSVIVHADHLGKKFRRSWHSGLFYGLADFLRKRLHLKPGNDLRPDEFWALQDISFELRQGECLGLIGPNGAGKSTLLRLINREYRPDRGQVRAEGAALSLIRLGSGLQPQFSGRENIYLRCSQLGLDKLDIDRRVDEIVAFAELERAIDAPVKTYSDGMYARLEFAIATCATMDLLLIDEVLAVGDIAFQLRCLDRLAWLKQQGTAIVFVSHSEMNMRQIADRCLLLFDGRQVALGDPDALFYQYHAVIGYLDRSLKPLGVSPPPPPVRSDLVAIRSLQPVRRKDEAVARTGGELVLELAYDAYAPISEAALIVHVRNLGRVLIGSIDSRLANLSFALERGSGKLRLTLPFLSLTAGVYHLSAGFLGPNGEWLAYGRDLLDLPVAQVQTGEYSGLVALEARFETPE
ncbi:ABC transporter ATP-binding protein [Methylococcus sp. EFPC2]|uniref:ABC transporter ATP-binding protein n=1 Tax=Methylococcus sp. EFPC2 TaxID=2812648 RepID=UPI0019686861|nr:ABC transporter ATP-binding protein [Methylococcus sp. EFPC2]QSA96045.1 ATP-binding cassette domain-containing protein [Methylococcus sp. EFPC2]